MTTDETKKNNDATDTASATASEASVKNSKATSNASSSAKSKADKPAVKKSAAKSSDKKTVAKSAVKKSTAKSSDKKASGPVNTKKAAAKKTTPTGSSEAIRIKLKSFDIHLLEKVCHQIIEVGKSFSQVRGPIPLPSSRHIDTILISPHKYKDARDQYEIKVYKRLIDILDVKPEFLDQLFSLNIPAGVDISPKVYVRKKS